MKIRDSLFCVTNRCIKVTSKLILPSLSIFKFCPPYKIRVKLIFICFKLIKVFSIYWYVLKLITIMLEQYCVISFGFLYFHQRNHWKLTCNCCDEFEQVNSSWLISYVFSCKEESIWNERHMYWICDLMSHCKVIMWR